MNLIKFISLFGILALHCSAQLPGKPAGEPIKGTFYVSVNDTATIFVNGQNAYQAPFGDSRSPEMELKMGDRIVVQLRNEAADRHFICLFASADGLTVVSFKHHDFKIVPDLGVTDFTPEQFQKWNKSAKEEKQKKAEKLPVKSYSEFIWGDLEKCIIAGPVTPQMITRKPQ